MIDAFERFLNWLSDSDWFWGPLLYLRPPQNVRITLHLWLKMIGLTLLVAVPVGGILGSLLAYYDYTATTYHDTKIPPVAAAERWMTHSSTQTSLIYLFMSACLVAACILAGAAHQWAWNRRADRLNREPVLPQPIFADAPDAWPPPPMSNGETMS